MQTKWLTDSPQFTTNVFNGIVVAEPWMLRDALVKILTLHGDIQEYEPVDADSSITDEPAFYCRACGDEYPCDTIQTIAQNLDVDAPA